MYNRTKQKNAFVLIFVCFSVFMFITKTYGQDLHYTQFYNQPLNLKHALTGIYNGDQRFIGSVRDQWRSVPVPWFTFSGSYDQKIYLDNHEDGFLGVGGVLNYDQQGDSRLNLTSISLMGSYTRILHPNHLLSGGLLIGFASRGFDTESLTWDSQWTGQRFDPSLSSNETFDNQRISYFETGLGLNYRFQKTERTYLNAGLGIFHLIEPTTNFYNTDDQTLPRHFSFYGVGNVQLAKALDVQLHAMHQIQDVYNETVLGGLAKLYLSQQRGKELGLHLGVGYRTSGAWAPTVALEYNQWYASFSYDIDVSDFENATASRGGPELHVWYVIKHVKNLDKRKICPIY